VRKCCLIQLPLPQGLPGAVTFGSSFGRKHRRGSGGTISTTQPSFAAGSHGLSSTLDAVASTSPTSASSAGCSSSSTPSSRRSSICSSRSAILLRALAAGCITFTHPVATRWNASLYTSDASPSGRLPGPTGPRNASGLFPCISASWLPNAEYQGMPSPSASKDSFAASNRPGKSRTVTSRPGVSRRLSSRSGV
jgi:hypothetical protein